MQSKIARLQPADFFGQPELAGSSRVTAVHASDEAPVELLALHHDEFLPLLQSSPLTQEALVRIVEDRIESRD
jgi:CRP-like cAMP-binding protein